MEASGISHIAICVRDLDRSLAFYRDILGMRVTFEAVQDTQERFGERMSALYEKQRESRRVAHVRYGESGNTAPSLVLTTHPDDRVDGDPIRLDHLGISHLSFTVKDPTALAHELADKGVKLAGPLESYKNAEGKIRNFYVYDPDGILVQFDDGSGG